MSVQGHSGTSGSCASPDEMASLWDPLDSAFCRLHKDLQLHTEEGFSMSVRPREVAKSYACLCSTVLCVGVA